MQWPYYDDPQLCQLLCLLFNAIGLFIGLAAWYAPRRAGAPRSRLRELAFGAVVLGATASVPLCIMIEQRTARVALPWVFGFSSGIAVLGLWRLRGWRAALATIPFAVFTIVWCAHSSKSAVEALLTWWIAFSAVAVGGPLRHDALVPTPPSSDRVARSLSTWLARAATPRAQDVVLALLGALVAFLSTRYITEGFVGSGDEWGNEYQAAVFAKGHAYGQKWPCFESLRMFYVFWEDDRTFSQYAPGFPAFLALFVPLRITPYVHVPILAAIVVLVARITRRFSPARQRSWTGMLAGGLLLACTAVVNMVGTRYPHAFGALCFAAVVELAFVLHERHEQGRTSWLPAIAFGVALGWGTSSRVQDGVLLGLGPGLFLLWGVIRRRIDWRAFLLVLVVSGSIVAVTLVVLHAQTGVWFRLGYDLNERIHPWNAVHRSLPGWSLLKWHLPWLVGGSTWLPLTPVLAALGLGAVHARVRREATTENRAALHMTWALALSSVALVAFYAISEVARGHDNGPSPRYQFPLVIPMAIGTTLFVSELLARVPLPRVRGAVLVAFAGAVVALGVVIAPRAFRPMNETSRSRSPGAYAARRDGLHHAIVYIKNGAGTSPEWDWPQNWPVELYEPDNLYALIKAPSERRCIEKHWPDRAIYEVDHWNEAAKVIDPVKPPKPAASAP